MTEGVRFLPQADSPRRANKIFTVESPLQRFFRPRRIRPWRTRPFLSLYLREKRVNYGGGGEIRTHGRVAPTTIFKTVALNRSATPPIVFSTIPCPRHFLNTIPVCGHLDSLQTLRYKLIQPVSGSLSSLLFPCYVLPVASANPWSSRYTIYRHYISIHIQSPCSFAPPQAFPGQINRSATPPDRIL